MIRIYRDLNEDLIVDNSVHSDLDPLEAAEWSIGISLQVLAIFYLVLRFFKHSPYGGAFERKN